MCVGRVPWLTCVSHWFRQVFIGDYFGPAGVPLSIMATGQQSGVVEGAVLRTSACSVVGAGHTRIHCSTPSGVGAGYTWTVTVAGQSSAPSVQTTSYAVPSLTAVSVASVGVVDAGEPFAMPTAGGAIVTLRGSNFGPDSSAVVVTWNGLAMPDVAVTVPHSSLSFTSLPGQGAAGVNVTLSVGGQAAISVVHLPFSAPRITFLRLDRTFDTEASLDCRDVGPDGRPTGGPVSGYAVVVIQGVNFGRGNATVATIRDVNCGLRAPIEDSQIVCQTDMCAGGLECLRWAYLSKLRTALWFLSLSDVCLVCTAVVRRSRSCSRGRRPVPF